MRVIVRDGDQEVDLGVMDVVPLLGDTVVWRPTGHAHSLDAKVERWTAPVTARTFEQRSNVHNDGTVCHSHGPFDGHAAFQWVCVLDVIDVRSVSESGREERPTITR